MKKNKILFLVFLLLFSVALTACSRGKEKDETQPPAVGDSGQDEGTGETDQGGTSQDGESNQDGEKDPVTDGGLGGSDDGNGTPDEDTDTPNEDGGESKMERLEIYSIDDNTLETTAVTAMVDTTGGLTVKTVIDAVVLALEDHAVNVKLNEVTVSGEKVMVDFKAEDAMKPFGDAGTSVESTVLDCITYSVFDHFDSCKSIYFTVNGGEYESGHIYLPKDEPYAVNE